MRRCGGRPSRGRPGASLPSSCALLVAFRRRVEGVSAATHRQRRSGGLGKNDGMTVALIVIVLLMLFMPFVLVGVLFVWGAAKDGQEDRAVQRRLGIRRRTRLGR